MLTSALLDLRKHTARAECRERMGIKSKLETPEFFARPLAHSPRRVNSEQALEQTEQSF
jgi:hypothetical protein